MEEIMELYRSRRYAEALELCRREIAKAESQEEKIRLELMRARILLARDRSSELQEEFDKLRGHFEEIRDHDLRAEVGVFLLKYLIRFGRYDEAIEEGKELLEALKDRQINRTYALLSMLVGDALLKKGSLGDAEDFLIDAIAAFRRIGEHDGVVSCYNRLAKAMKDISRFSRALEFLEKAADYAQKHGLDTFLGPLYGNQAVILIKLGRFNRAGELIQLARRNYETHGANSHERIQLTFTGVFLDLQRHELDRAERGLSEVQKDLIESGDPRAEALFHELVGILRLKRGEAENALHHFKRSLEIGERIAPRGEIVNQAKRWLGETYLALEELEKAADCLRDSVEISDEMGDKHEKAAALRALGHVELKRGHREKAVKILRKVGELFESMGNEFEKAITLLEISVIAARNGDSRADTFAAMALRTFELSGSEYWMARAAYALATAYGAQKKYAEAFRELDRAEEAFRKFGDEEYIARSGELRDQIDAALVSVAAKEFSYFFRKDRIEREEVRAKLLLENFVRELDAASGLIAFSDVPGEIKVEAAYNIDRSELTPILSDFDALMAEGRNVRFSSRGNDLRVRFRTATGNGFLYIKGNGRPLSKEDILGALRFSDLLEYLFRTQPLSRNEGRSVSIVIPSENRYIVTRNPEMLDILAFIEKISDLPLPVLIYGETGTGKELIARYIHRKSRRSAKPFVPVNCANIPTSILESELFGFKKGAFTDAYEDRKGWFEVADGGTIFLDEVAEAGPTVQAKLLRFLEDKIITPLGSRESRKVDVRFLAATNKRLEDEVREGRFREDLYYRLKGVLIELPPLRERRDDIPLLAGYFLEKVRTELGIEVVEITRDGLDLLMDYPWPGNVRELENVIKSAAVHAGAGGKISREILRTLIGDTTGTEVRKLKAELEDIEKKRILRVLEEVGWNKSRAARILGLSRQGLILKIKKYGLTSTAVRQ